MAPKRAPATPRQKSQAWSAAEDALLITARRQGCNWVPLAQRHFPGKSSNACRKRHERLMEQERLKEYDAGIRAEDLAHAYWRNREAMWSPVAAQLGERNWEVVEAKCFSKGLKNLRGDYGRDTPSTNDYLTTRNLGSSGSSAISGNSPDSGIGMPDTDYYRHPAELWGPPTTDHRGHLMPPPPQQQHYGPLQPQQAYYPPQQQQQVSAGQPAYRTQIVEPRSHHQPRSAPRGPPSIPSMLSAPSHRQPGGRWPSPRR